MIMETINLIYYLKRVELINDPENMLIIYRCLYSNGFMTIEKTIRNFESIPTRIFDND